MKIFFLRYGKQSSLFLDRYSETKPFRADCNLAGGRRGAIKKRRPKPSFEFMGRGQMDLRGLRRATGTEKCEEWVL